MRLVHLVNWYNAKDMETRRRMSVARKCWEQSGMKLGLHRLASRDRSGLTVGDSKAVPFLRDVLDWGTDTLAGFDGVVFTNADVGLVREAQAVITKQLESVGCCYSFRVDFQRLDRPIETLAELSTGQPYCGADLFAFTPRWWIEHRSQIPDLLLGYEGWDFVMKRAMERSGFDPNSIPPVIWHERHNSDWQTNLLTAKGNLHNRALCIKWAIANGERDELYMHPPFLFG